MLNSYDVRRKRAGSAPPRTSANGALTSTIENVEAFSIARNTIYLMVALLSLLRLREESLATKPFKEKQAARESSLFHFVHSDAP
jgi:hypothetical protein